METLLQGLANVVVYLHDIILIGGPTDEARLKTLEEVLTRMELAGFSLKKSKCVFMADSVTYVSGTPHRCRWSPSSSQKVVMCTKPCNVSELKSYLGLLTYYGKFLSNQATTLASLYKLLKTSMHWCWSSEQNGAFEASKKLCTSSQLLVHFNPYAQETCVSM